MHQHSPSIAEYSTKKDATVYIRKQNESMSMRSLDECWRGWYTGKKSFLFARQVSNYPVSMRAVMQRERKNPKKHSHFESITK